MADPKFLLGCVLLTLSLGTDLPGEENKNDLPLEPHQEIYTERLDGELQPAMGEVLWDHQERFQWLGEGKREFSIPVGKSQWFRIPLALEAGSGGDSFFLVVDNHSFYEITWYLRSGGETLGLGEFSYRVPFSQRSTNYRYPLLPFSLEGRESGTLYLKVHSRVSSDFPFSILDTGQLREKRQQADIMHGILFGILFVLIFYNFFNVVFMRDKAYGFFIVYIMVYAYYLANLQGLDHLLFYPGLSGGISLFLSPFLGGVTMTLAVLFIRFYFSGSGDYPGILILQRVLLVMALMLVLLPMTGLPWAVVFRLGNLLGSGVVLGALFVGLFHTLKGYRPGIFFLTANGSVILGTVVYTLLFFGVLPNNSLTRYANLLGAMVQMLLLSVGLAYRMSLFREEKERAQEQAVAALRAADKMKDQFLANTSHELRTPLNGIIGIAESLLHGAGGPINGRAEKNLRLIVTSGERLKQLINDLLDFSRIKEAGVSLRREKLWLRPMGDRILNLLRPSLSGGAVTLSNRIPQGLPPVWADSRRVEQVLLNLVGNGLKFTPRGEVSLSAERAGEEGWVIIHVDDSGPGIPPEERDRIFGEFETLEDADVREHGGTGLGLAISRTLVQLHGGTLRVTDAPEGGARFSFGLQEFSKADKADSQEEAAGAGDFEELSEVDGLNEVEEVGELEDLEEAASAVPEGGSGPEGRRSEGEGAASGGGLERTEDTAYTILVVDDESVNRQVMVNQLGVYGFQVFQARDGEEALSMVGGENHPDLILLDVMMPRMSGYEVCRIVRRDYSLNALPVIMLTAKNQLSSLLQGFEAGANDYLTKPIVQKELYLRIKTHLQLSQISLAYGRFVPQEFLQQLNRESIIDVQIGDHVRQNMAVLFVDIRSFTTLTEEMGPEETFTFINQYLKRVCPLITRNGGFIDKFIGDAVMALFPEDADDALRAAQEIRQAVEVFNSASRNRGGPEIEVGIGIHQGSLMLGTVGAESRMEGTVISDAVNIASRLEGLSKVFGAGILTSDRLIKALRDPEGFEYRFLGKVQMKGKRETVSLFEVLDQGDREGVQNKRESLDIFEKGLLAYYSRDFSLAEEAFEQVSRINPEDRACDFFLREARRLQREPPSEEWEGVLVMENKG